MSVQDTALTASTKANKVLIASIGNLSKTIAELENLAPAHEELMLKIEMAQGEMDAITTQTETARREAAADLKILIKEDRAEVLAELLKEAGLVSISPEELAALRQDLDAAVDANTEIARQTADSVAQKLTAKFTSEKELLQANFERDRAGDTARINQLEGQVAFLQENSTKLENMLADERTARVKVAEAQKPQVYGNNGANTVR